MTAVGTPFALEASETDLAAIQTPVLQIFDLLRASCLELADAAKEVRIAEGSLEQTALLRAIGASLVRQSQAMELLGEIK